MKSARCCTACRRAKRPSICCDWRATGPRAAATIFRWPSLSSKHRSPASACRRRRSHLKTRKREKASASERRIGALLLRQRRRRVRRRCVVCLAFSPPLSPALFIFDPLRLFSLGVERGILLFLRQCLGIGSALRAVGGGVRRPL